MAQVPNEIQALMIGMGFDPEEWVVEAYDTFQNPGEEKEAKNS